MGTANFYFKNRCIVVSGEDIDNGNMPRYEEESGISLRSFPCYRLSIADKYRFVEPTINFSYYEGACLDWHYNERTAGDILGLELYYGCPSTSRLFSDYKGVFPNLTRKAFRDAVSSVRRAWGLKRGENPSEGDKWDYVIDIDHIVTDYLLKREIADVNIELTRLKELYGYDEYKVIGRFDNGETMYAKAW